MAAVLRAAIVEVASPGRGPSLGNGYARANIVASGYPNLVSATASGSTLTFAFDNVVNGKSVSPSGSGTGWNPSGPVTNPTVKSLQIGVSPVLPDLSSVDASSGTHLDLTFSSAIGTGVVTPTGTPAGTGWDVNGNTSKPGTTSIRVPLKDVPPSLLSATANTGDMALVFDLPVNGGTPTLSSPGTNVPTLTSIATVSATAFNINWTAPVPAPAASAIANIIKYLKAGTTMRKPQKIQFNDSQLSRLQDQIHNTYSPLLDAPLADSVLIKNVVLTTGDNSVNHGLGRQPLGWMVVSQSGAATFYDKQATNLRPDQTLIINSSADVTVSLVVF